MGEPRRTSVPWADCETYTGEHADTSEPMRVALVQVESREVDVVDCCDAPTPLLLSVVVEDEVEFDQDDHPTDVIFGENSPWQALVREYPELSASTAALGGTPVPRLPWDEVPTDIGRLPLDEEPVPLVVPLFEDD